LRDRTGWPRRLLVRDKGKGPVLYRPGLELEAGIDGAGVEGVELVGMADDVGGVRDSANGENLDLADGRVIELPPLVLERPAERRLRRDELRVELAVVEPGPAAEINAAHRLSPRARAVLRRAPSFV
jgi:hypothetical protein